jgi:DNA-directed RNA polymerase sigma subunit (sigma70/sigma32)
VDESGSIASYLAEVRRLPVLRREDEAMSLLSARSGDEEAHRRVIEGYLELTAILAVRLAPRWLGWLDAVQEANLVLLETVNDDSVAVPASCLADRLLEHFDSLEPPERR